MTLLGLSNEKTFLQLEKSAVKWRIRPLKKIFLQEIFEHGIFHGIAKVGILNLLKNNGLKVLLIIEWE